MAKSELNYTFVGSDASRARALALTPRRPRFAVGEVVMDAHGDIGAIDAIYADLTAVADAGVISNPAKWLRELEIEAKTPADGIWYSLVYGRGAGVAGELDLQLAPTGSASRP